MPLIDFFHEEFRRFFKKLFSFSNSLFHAGDYEVLPSSRTETSPHHFFGILRDTSAPSWKQWL